jgi:hypothetical protein
MAIWPGNLQPYPLVADYAESPPNTMLRTEMDSGPAIMRQRYVAGPRPISGSVVLRSKQELNDLDTFFVTTLKGGTLPFTWNDRNAVPRTFRFTAPPSYAFLEPDKIKVTMALEIMP